MSWLASQITDHGLFSEIFDEESILVPVPRSSPTVKHALWPSESVAKALHQRGVGGSVRTMLRRTTAVTKSATASRGNRPTPGMHMATMAVDVDMSIEGGIVLIDDVVTLGATMLAAKMLFVRASPWLSVRGFAPIRTMGLQPEVHMLIDPWISEIGGNEQSANRTETRCLSLS
jgi:predicted amidophosphoribosyltransferase